MRKDMAEKLSSLSHSVFADNYNNTIIEEKEKSHTIVF